MGNRRSGRRPDQERRRQVGELRAQGLTFAEIGRRLGITPEGARRLAVLATGRRPGEPRPCPSCGRPLPRGPRAGPCPACVLADPGATFGQRLQALREAAGLSRRELSVRAGPGARAIGRYEQGQAHPASGSLEALARALGPGLLGETPG